MLNRPWLKQLAAFLIRFLPLWLYRVLLRLTQKSFLVGATAWVFDREGRVLLLKHVFHADYPWGPPGGWLKHGENPVVALAREVYEETGLTIRVHQPLYVQEKEGHLDLVYFATTDGGAMRLSGEIFEAGFFDPRQIPYGLRRYHAEVLPWAMAAYAAQRAAPSETSTPAN